MKMGQKCNVKVEFNDGTIKRRHFRYFVGVGDLYEEYDNVKQIYVKDKEGVWWEYEDFFDFMCSPW